MILSDKTITRMLKERSLVIKPITAKQLQPASVDIRIGRTYSVVDDTPSGILTLDSEIKYKTNTRCYKLCLFYLPEFAQLIVPYP